MPSSSVDSDQTMWCPYHLLFPSTGYSTPRGPSAKMSLLS